MSIQSIIRSGADVAVFTRNHREYLVDAAAAAPEERIVFRAAIKWSSVEDALLAKSPRTLYISPIGAEGMIEYLADLHDVHLDPEYGQSKTEELLRQTLSRTRDEGLWEKYDQTVRTLYTISNCRKLPVPFPQTELVKISDGTSISSDYGYSYTIVYPNEKES